MLKPLSQSTPPHPDLSLRPMQIADIAEVVAIEQAAYQGQQPQRDYQQEIGQNKAAHYLILMLGGTPIGVAGFWVMADEAHITTIAIHPIWQRQQFGEWLLIHLLAAAIKQKVKVATLEVRCSNERAIAFYRKYNFAEAGRRPQYYQDEDALILTTPPLTTKSYIKLLSERRKDLQFAHPIFGGSH